MTARWTIAVCWRWWLRPVRRPARDSRRPDAARTAIRERTGQGVEVAHHAEPAARSPQAPLRRTIVALKGGTLDIVNEKGETVKKLAWESGKVYWLDKIPAGEQHGEMNRGTEPIEVMVVQFRR